MKTLQQTYVHAVNVYVLFISILLHLVVDLLLI